MPWGDDSEMALGASAGNYCHYDADDYSGNRRIGHAGEYDDDEVTHWVNPVTTFSRT
jgi:hypothetical protein